MKVRSKVAAKDGPTQRREAMGRLIRVARRETTQLVLGRLLGDVPQSTISRWEKGTCDLTLEQVLQIEDALGVERGTLAAGAGYGRTTTESITDLIMADQSLDMDFRLQLVDNYNHLREWSTKTPTRRGRAKSEVAATA